MAHSAKRQPAFVVVEWFSGGALLKLSQRLPSWVISRQSSAAKTATFQPDHSGSSQCSRSSQSHTVRDDASPHKKAHPSRCLCHSLNLSDSSPIMRRKHRQIKTGAQFQLFGVVAERSFPHFIFRAATPNRVTASTTTIFYSTLEMAQSQSPGLKCIKADASPTCTRITGSI